MHGTRAIRSHSATPLQQRRKHAGQGKQGQGKRSSMIQVKITSNVLT